MDHTHGLEFSTRAWFENSGMHGQNRQTSTANGHTQVKRGAQCGSGPAILIDI